MDRTGRPMKVLIVNDIPATRRVVRSLLEQIGWIESQEAGDGPSALEMLRSGGYGLVISAWKMPGMDGLQLLRNMKQDPLLSPIPFLIMTTEAAKTKVMEAVKAGVDGYLVEPFTAEGLREKLGRLAAGPEAFKKTV